MPMRILFSLFSSLFGDKALARGAVLAGFFMALFCVLLLLYPPEFLSRLDSLSYDILLRQTAKTTENPEVIIVEIDELSLEKHGQWPWPRYQLADLLRTINSGKPIAVGVDMVLAEPDRMSLTSMRRTLKQKFSVDLNLQNIDDQLQDNDAILANVLRSGPFYLGEIFRYGSSQEVSKEVPPAPLMIEQSEKSGFSPAAGVIPPLPLLAAAAGTGFLNVQADSDGVVRRAPLLIKYDGKLWPSMALLLAAKKGGVTSARLEVNGNRRELYLDGELIPLDGNGNLNIHFHGGRYTAPGIPADMLMTGVIPPDVFSGKIVLVGFSAEGLADSLSTPFTSRVFGTEVQAAVVNTLLNRDFIVTPPWGRWLAAGLLCISILIVSLILSRFSTLVITLICGGLLLLFPLIAVSLFVSSGIFLPVASAALLYCLSFFFFTFLHFRGEELRSLEYERQLASGQESTILGLASVVETRDTHTGQHVLRMRNYVLVLAEYFRRTGLGGVHLSRQEVDILYKTSALHDIGKVGVPDRILLKPGRLTREEFKEMQMHTLFGAESLDMARGMKNSDNGDFFLLMARDIALTHHEKWDGSGYPMGLAGEAIPFGGRLVAVADVYDALVSWRPYKDGMSHEQAAKFICEASGTHFDPDVVEAFKACEEQFVEIATIWNATEHVPIRDVALEVIDRFLEDEKKRRAETSSIS